MQFNHYGGEAARLAADLANCRPGTSPAQLVAVLAGRGISAPAVTARQVPALLAWAEQLGACFGTTAAADLVEMINVLLARGTSQVHVSLHDGRPHLHYDAPGQDVVTHVRAVTSTGLAYVVCFAGGHRLGRCARSSCRRAFVDTSRNGRRTYCSLRCANNDAVARHRQRNR